MTYYQWNDLYQLSNTVGTQIFMSGFFACLMTAFPVAMLALLPHDGWRRGEYAAKDRARIKQLEDENEKLRKELIDQSVIIDAMLKEAFKR
jgi:hypothetical protein